MNPSGSVPNRDVVLERHEQFKTSLPYFCRTGLVLKAKEGGMVPFAFTPTQFKIHKFFEDMKREAGLVRGVVVKARQVRCSSYVCGRYYRDGVYNPALGVAIITHRSDVTNELFEKIQTFHEQSPDQLKPKLLSDNNKQLVFNNRTKFKAATAGTDAGRGFPLQRLLISEAGRFDKMMEEDVQTGAFQTVPVATGTEVVVESTAQGMNTWFHNLVIQAQEKRGLYRLLFLSWKDEQEYRVIPPPGWEFTPEERRLQELFNLDAAQMYWRYLKITDELGGSEALFKQEYPLTVEEAFQSAASSLITPEAVMVARKTKITDPTAPIILGVDPARTTDRTVIVKRQGRCFEKYWVYDKMDSMTLAGIVAGLIESERADKVFIDVGMGYGTIDRLHELRYNHMVVGVHFGQKAMQPEIYGNKRAEMGYAVRDWLHGGGVSIPDDDAVSSDLLAVPEKMPLGSRGLLYLPPKEEIKKEYGKSTDIFDGLCLTFAYPVRKRDPAEDKVRDVSSPLSTLNHIRGRGQGVDNSRW